LPAFQNSTRISIYLSTDYEVNTIDLLRKMFNDGKEVSAEFNLSISITKMFSKIFVPTYSGQEMKMLRLYDYDDYEKLPLTKWNIKQPNPDDERRENPMMTGDTAATGLDCVY
jgi:5-formyltetrahydrofolate cyclo-ligase